MKAIRLHAYDERPHVDDVDEPTADGPLDVVVRIGGAGLCRTDLHVVEGQWADKTEVGLPYTLGHENAGWVHQVGSAVEGVEVGDAVIVHPLVTCGQCLPCRRGDDMHCVTADFPGIDTDGGMADFLKTSSRSLVSLPDGIEPAAVAAHADAGLTAYHAVKKAAASLWPGDRVVVIGAGGLGHIGIQCLRAMTAADIVVVDRNPAALDLAKACGADELVEADGSEVDAVLDLTDGDGAEAVLDFVGEWGAVETGKQLVRRHGNYYVIGYSDPLEIPTIDIISTEISFIGNLVGTYADLVELMELAARGVVDLETTTYPLDAVHDAIDDLEQGRLQGRGVLVPAGA